VRDNDKPQASLFVEKRSTFFIQQDCKVFRLICKFCVP